MKHADFITVTRGLRGFFSVQMTWDVNCDCYVPLTTHHSSYRDISSAERDGRVWAKYEELRYIKPERYAA